MVDDFNQPVINTKPMQLFKPDKLDCHHERYICRLKIINPNDVVMA